MNEKKMKDNLNKFHAQRSFWKENIINVLCWAFYCINDDKKVDMITFQTMCCILCNNNPILNLT
jgi:hypothetical protein